MGHRDGGIKVTRPSAVNRRGCHGRLVRPCRDPSCMQRPWQASCQCHPAVRGIVEDAGLDWEQFRTEIS